MKKRIICFIILGVLLLQGIIYAEELKEITAYIVNHSIYYEGYEREKEFEYPLISYDNHTYISIRDMANLLTRNVEWKEDSEQIWIKKSSSEDYLIKEEETALQIGKALVEEKYANRLTEKTRYCCSYGDYDSTLYEGKYCIGVKFDATKEMPKDSPDELLYILNEGDVRIEISPIDGSIKILEKDEDDNWVYVRR